MNENKSSWMLKSLCVFLVPALFVSTVYFSSSYFDLKSRDDNKFRNPNYCDTDERVVVLDVLDTGSMNPFVYKGFLTFEEVSNVSDLNIGDVIVYSTNDHNGVDEMHSIYSITSNGFVTKGYNSKFLDKQIVSFENIKYRYCTLLPNKKEGVKL